MLTEQDISLRCEEEEMWSICNLLFQLINPTNINDMKWEWDIMQAILLALNTHSTYHESGCQAMHKQEAQNTVCCILHEVQLFVIVTSGEKNGQQVYAIQPFNPVYYFTVTLYLYHSITNEDSE